ncbi:MAG: class IV adenylate cyclase [Thermoplasmatota archaeon]
MDGYEVEVKAVLRRGAPGKERDVLKESMVRRIAELGGKLRSIVEHEDIYLSHPSRDFKETDEAFRIRKERRDDRPFVLMTYKGPKLSERSKSRFEKEVALQGGDCADDILELLVKLGFSKVLEVKKSRTFLDLGDVKLSIDEVEGLGLFLEAEVRSEDIRGSEDELFELMGRLEVREFERRSYLELLLEK